MPDFVAVNQAKKSCKFEAKGENLFAALKFVFLNNYIYALFLK